MKEKIRTMEAEKQKNNDNKAAPKKFSPFQDYNQSDEYFNAEISRLSLSIEWAESKISARQDLLKNPRSLARSTELLLNTWKSRAQFMSKDSSNARLLNKSIVPLANNSSTDTLGENNNTIQNSIIPDNSIGKNPIPTVVTVAKINAERIKQDAEQEKMELEAAKKIEQELKDILDKNDMPPAEKKEKIQKIRENTPATPATTSQLEAADATIKKIEIQQQKEDIKKTNDTFTQHTVDAIKNLIKQSPEAASKVLNVSLKNESDINEFMKLLDKDNTWNEEPKIRAKDIRKSLDSSVWGMAQSYIASITDASLQQSIVESYSKLKNIVPENATQYSFDSLKNNPEFIQYILNTDWKSEGISLPIDPILGTLNMSFPEYYWAHIQPLILAIDRLSTVQMAADNNNDQASQNKNELDWLNATISVDKIDRDSHIEQADSDIRSADMQIKEINAYEWSPALDSIVSDKGIDMQKVQLWESYRDISPIWDPVTIVINTDHFIINGMQYPLTTHDPVAMKQALDMYIMIDTMPVLASIQRTPWPDNQTILGYFQREFKNKYSEWQYQIPEDADKFIAFMYNRIVNWLNQRKGLDIWDIDIPSISMAGLKNMVDTFWATRNILAQNKYLLTNAQFDRDFLPTPIIGDNLW